jgi:hypothetical protein
LSSQYLISVLFSL